MGYKDYWNKPQVKWAQAVLEVVRDGGTDYPPIPVGISTRDAWNALKCPLRIWIANPEKATFCKRAERARPC